MIRNGNLRDFGIVIKIRLLSIAMNIIIPKIKRNSKANQIFSIVSVKKWILSLCSE